MINLLEKFRCLFNISESNQLVEVSFNKSGPLGIDELWEHEEIDSNGLLLARYESWSFTSKGNKSGWRKISPQGKTIEEHEELPI